MLNETQPGDCPAAKIFSVQVCRRKTCARARGGFSRLLLALRAEEQREKIVQASAPHAPVVSARVCFPDHLHLLAGEEGIVGIMYTR